MFARIDLLILVILFCFCNFCTLVFYIILSLPPLFPLLIPLHIHVIVNIELNNDRRRMPKHRSQLFPLIFTVKYISKV